MNFFFDILDRKECFLDHKSEIAKTPKSRNSPKGFCQKMKIFVLCVIFGKLIAWISSNYFESLLLPQ